MNFTPELQSLLTIACSLVTVLAFFYSRREDANKNVETITKVNYKLDTQCQDISSIKESSKETNKLLREIMLRQERHENDIKNLYHCYDKLYERVTLLEKNNNDNEHKEA